MPAALHSHSRARDVGSAGSATVQRWCARELEAKRRWRTAACEAILVCHSERSEASTQRTKSARPGFQSQFVIRVQTNQRIQRCFASLNMTEKFTSSQKASDSSDTNHSENVQSDRTFFSAREIV